VPVMPAGRLAEYGRRAVLPGLLRTGMATGVSSAGLRRLAGSGVRGLDDVGVSGRDGLAVEFYGGGDLIAAGLSGYRQDGGPLGLLHPGQRAVGGLDCRPRGASVRGCAAGPSGSW